MLRMSSLDKHVGQKRHAYYLSERLKYQEQVFKIAPDTGTKPIQVTPA